MPITFSGTATKRLEILVQKVGQEGLRGLTEQLAEAMIEELSTIPANWEGNIKKGLLQRTTARPTDTGGWVVGIGSRDILHGEPAPPRTISQFLYWFQKEHKPERSRKRAEARRERRVEKARGKKEETRKIRVEKARKARNQAELKYSDAVEARDAAWDRLQELIRRGGTEMDAIGKATQALHTGNNRVARISAQIRKYEKQIGED